MISPPTTPPLPPPRLQSKSTCPLPPPFSPRSTAAAQTVEDGDEAGTTAAVETESAGAIKADLMRGEMVGINCNFSAIVELRVSILGAAIYTAIFSG